MKAAPYYALQASLPPLPYFATAERLPISELRVNQRIGMLSPEDRARLESAMDLVRWQRQSPERSDALVARQYMVFMRDCDNTALRDFVEYRSGLRAALAALRMRRRNKTPDGGSLLGFGRWDALLRSRWDQHNFGLEALFPWLSDAHRLLDDGDALGLERLLMDAVWRQLQPLQERYPYRFEAIFSYLFRWDILSRWMAFDQQGALVRLEQLMRGMYAES